MRLEPFNASKEPFPMPTLVREKRTEPPWSSTPNGATEDKRLLASTWLLLTACIRRMTVMRGSSLDKPKLLRCGWDTIARDLGWSNTQVRRHAGILKRLKMIKTARGGVGERGTIQLLPLNTTWGTASGKIIYTRLPWCVQLDGELSPQLVRLYTVLRMKPYRGIKKLAADLGCSVSTIGRQLKLLATRGLVAIESNYDPRTGKSTNATVRICLSTRTLSKVYSQAELDSRIQQPEA